MPPTPTNSFIVDALRRYAHIDAEEQQQKLIANTPDFDSKELEVKLALNRAHQFVGNPDGTFPCPHCFIRGDNNILNSYGINRLGSSEFRCDICNKSFYV